MIDQIIEFNKTFVAQKGYEKYLTDKYPDNPIGLHLEFFAKQSGKAERYEDGDYIVSTWRPEHNYQGWVDTMNELAEEAKKSTRLRKNYNFHPNATACFCSFSAPERKVSF